jgi:hypothetical protein
MSSHFPIEASPENIMLAKDFVFRKWLERATEMGLQEPEDLSGSCKFTSMFAQKVFGGRIRGNYHHQFVELENGEILDLNMDARDVKSLGELAYYHDRRFFGNPDHRESLKSCMFRVQTWVTEFITEIHSIPRP